MMDNQLTKKQIINWRKVLTGMIGPYASIASDEEIQALRDKFQAKANSYESVEDMVREGK